MKKLFALLILMGLDLEKFILFFLHIPGYIWDIFTYKNIYKGSGFDFELKEAIPMLTDKRQKAGAIGGHYFFQDIWAAKLILKEGPKVHIDIGSRIDGFISHLLCFREVTVVDIRPIGNHGVDGLHFIQSDATNLDIFEDCSVESVSSLHAIEHFGLGRYGDEIDPDACFKAMQSLARILKPGGKLYFSVPIGQEKLKFNAHRIFSPWTIIQKLQPLKLISFSAINDNGQFCSPANLGDYTLSKNSCGLFEFWKER